MLARLPHHTPHREARLLQTEKVLHALMVEAHLVKELLVVSSAPTNERQGGHPQGKGWRKYGATVADHVMEGQRVARAHEAPAGRRTQAANSGWRNGDVRGKSRATARKRERKAEVVSHSVAIITAPGVGNEG